MMQHCYVSSPGRQPQMREVKDVAHTHHEVRESVQGTAT
jgi:hypothetical protein